MKIRLILNGKRVNLGLPMDDEGLSYVMKRYGVEEVSPVRRLIKGMDEGGILRPLEGQEINLDEVNFLARYMESMTKHQIKVMGAYVYEHGIESVKDLINLADSLSGLSLITDFSDRRETGKQLYMDLHQVESTEKLETIDFGAYLEEVLKNSYTDVTPYGVYVEQHFTMSQWYNGRTFPEYMDDPRKVSASLSVMNPQMQCDHLYLPTSRWSLQKLVRRLGAEQFEGLTIGDVYNLKLPEQAAMLAKDIRTAEELAYFNELCEVVAGYDDVAVARLSMAAEFVGAKRFQDYTYIAKHMKEFEIWMNVHNDEEYGKLLVTEPAMLKIDPAIVEHIDFSGLGASVRKTTLAASGYITDGFVGAKRPVQEYLQYEGEYGSLLEYDEGAYTRLCLVSSLWGRLEDCDRIHELDGRDLLEYDTEIKEAIEEELCAIEHSRGLMKYFHGSLSVAAKVVAAMPMVEERNGELCGVLECRIKGTLTEEELDELKEYWHGQASDGWGESFEQQKIEVEDGLLYVSFWTEGMEITAEMPSLEECQQAMQMNM